MGVLFIHRKRKGEKNMISVNILIEEFSWYLKKTNITDISGHINAVKKLLEKIISESLSIEKLTEKYITDNFSYSKTKYRLGKFLSFLKTKGIVTNEKAFLLNKYSDDSFEKCRNIFLEWADRKRKSISTVDSYKGALKHFEKYLCDIQINCISEIKRKTIEDFKNYLFKVIGKNGSKISADYQSAILNTVKLFFRILKKENKIIYNPTESVKSIKKYSYISQNYFSGKQNNNRRNFRN